MLLALETSTGGRQRYPWESPEGGRPSNVNVKTGAATRSLLLGYGENPGDMRIDGRIWLWPDATIVPMPARMDGDDHTSCQDVKIYRTDENLQLDVRLESFGSTA
jgi:hypothetical protein